MEAGKPLHHGGRLGEAVRRWGIPREQWIDLSTGINPVAWPVPAIPQNVWQRLPEDDDGLEDAVRRWSGAPSESGCVPVAGSQAAIQMLPRLRKPCRVGIPLPGYGEHARCWSDAGHTVIPIELSSVSDREDWLDALDVLVWINPNNPTGKHWSHSQLLGWHERLKARGGWLVVDEAFLLPENLADSLVPVADRPGIVVLKSLGKFFGLAGVRAGAALGDRDITGRLYSALGPWSLSHPARFLMRQALEDVDWQIEAQRRLHAAAGRLDAILVSAGLGLALDSISGTTLFRYAEHASAEPIADGLARQGILVRRFSSPAALRFGLPGAEFEWRRLEETLPEIVRSIGIV